MAITGIGVFSGFGKTTSKTTRPSASKISDPMDIPDTMDDTLDPPNVADALDPPVIVDPADPPNPHDDPADTPDATGVVDSIATVSAICTEIVPAMVNVNFEGR